MQGGDLLTNLNDEQAVAVAEASPDFVLAAGAGSGKTRVLTERFVRAVVTQGSGAFDSTLAITFTEKAAGELWQRVRSRVAEECGAEVAAHTDRAWISTIHSMCARLLRRHALDIGIDPSICVGSPVELGILRQRAFQAVAQEVLDNHHPDDPERRVLSALGLAETFSLAVGVSERVRAMGLAPERITTCEPMQSHEVKTALDELEKLAEAYRPLKQTQTVIDNTVGLEALAGAGRSWLAGTTAAEDVARTAGGLSQKRVGSQEVKDIAEAAKTVADRLGLIAAQEAVRSYETGLLGLVARFSDEYAAARKQANLLDFEDLQSYVIDLFERRPEVAARYANQFASVMIDEFQDTNALQIRLASGLAPKGFVAVGDERQSIYRFRHADVSIFNERAEAAGARRTLRTNYRSRPELVRFFNEIFGREPFWPQEFMELQAGRTIDGDPGDDSERITAILIDADQCTQRRDADEATIVAAHVRGLLDTGAEPGEIVILMRAMTAAETFAGALRDAGVEVFVASGGTYFDRPEVVDLEMLLRSVSNTKDDEALLHVLAGPLTDLSDNALGLLRDRAGSGSLWQACRDFSAPGLEADDAWKLERLVEVVSWFREGVERGGLADMIHEACERLEYDLTLFARGYEGARAWANILKLARIAGDFELGSPGDSQGFLEYLELKRELEGRESQAAFAAEDVGAVRVMSIHAAKGLEFPITIVANLGRQPVNRGSVVLSTGRGQAFLGMKLPSGADGADSLATLGYDLASRAEAEADLAEDKRLFYVACTRAQDSLVLSGRTAFERESESPRLVGWLRDALGFSPAGSIRQGIVELGQARVGVLTPEPTGCGPVGLARPKLDERALVIAAAGSPERPASTRAPIERVSYSGLSLFRTCAYRFYVSNVARLGSREPAETGNESAVALGNAVHVMLKVMGDAGSAPTDARLEEICRSAELPRELWPLGPELARVFLESETGQRVAKCTRVSRERAFAVPIGATLLDGVMDLIGWEGDAALVVDYKTGSPERERDPEEHRAQAECYAIAAFAFGARRVEVRFVELRRDAHTVSFAYERDDAQDLTARITREIEALAADAYRPLDRFDAFACPECPALGGLCPVSAPGRRPAG